MDKLSKTWPLLCVALVAGTAIAATPPESAPTTRAAAATEWASEGLQPIAVPGMDIAYGQPGVGLQAYRSVLVKPVSVSFQKNWERSAAIPAGTRVQPRDLDRIRKDLAEVVASEIKREFRKGGWQVVDAPGAGVLEIDARVAELYLNAPDIPTAGITKSYARSFGELTLVADLRDSATGAVLMRILDRTLGHEHLSFERVTRVDNAFEVGLVSSDWARGLRRQLELARVAGEGSNGRP